MTDTTVTIWIPGGYLEMPLTDIDQRIAVAQALVSKLPSSERTRMAHSLLPAIAALFTALAERDTRYCGIGRHRSSTGALVSSCLTVCVYQADQSTLNPRLAIKDLVESRNESGDVWASEPIDVDGHPMMFSERTIELPAPDIPQLHYTGSTTETYQLEAVVPAEDGTALAAIELSTVSTAHGTEFRRMIFDMARSIEFRPSMNSSSTSPSLKI
ncbi:hypothetical protein IU500_19325 [Nocardia terpenica]|uniref:hypothetical protein n=1 Tax=Nocardia terpenica TaxID=455432 RepID=UPI0018944359|nr:hypothetical protein [Nocardia terpenica]MBF6062010.1 hypothetical protein [Nocardia terpenica]MBF6106190.1 hypothetical protein [Nocardia terpenica]MBF6110430.1 hypothetical protein [Nocardia terpenica]MBF6120733.1 hypothetical protein [Nocardia terpenica]MBF6151766.1 hypothetical protein [Nocardia terpenica]